MLQRCSQLDNKEGTIGATVALEKFGPAFLEDHHPNKPSLGGFGIHRFVSVGSSQDRKQIIHHNFLVSAVPGHLAYVVSIGVVLLSLEDVVDAMGSLGEASHC